jgi:hypothetical protein
MARSAQSPTEKIFFAFPTSHRARFCTKLFRQHRLARRKHSHTAHRPTRQHWVQAKSSDEQPLPIGVIGKKGSHTTDKESNEKNIFFFFFLFTSQVSSTASAAASSLCPTLAIFWDARVEPWRAQQRPNRTDTFTFPTSHLARFCATLYSKR